MIADEDESNPSSPDSCLSPNIRPSMIAGSPARGSKRPMSRWFSTSVGMLGEERFVRVSVPLALARDSVGYCFRKHRSPAWGREGWGVGFGEADVLE